MKGSLNILQEETPWYHEGLNFKCTECGKCCTGSPGYVWITEEEIRAIAEHLNLPIEEFTRRYVRQVGDQFSLMENRHTYDCVFLHGNQCRIYPVRPKQCRTFPWWPQNLKSKEAWLEAAQYCEGITFEAPLVPYSEIKKQLEIQCQDDTKSKS